ncbi:MAG: transpeptidase family protein [Saprospiraceae bacterium]|nr:transpeptidase family protein [Saprospiraceae bacterium]
MKKVKKDILWRVYLVYFFMLAFGIAIISRVMFIQFAEGDIWKEKALKETVKEFDIKAIRGTIYASDGSVLATSVPIFDIRMDVASPLIPDSVFNRDIDSLSIYLANMFGDRHWRTYKSNLKSARRNGNRYHLVKRNVQYEQLKKLRKFPIYRRGNNRGGLIAIIKDRREMPFKLLAQRTIGFWRKGYNVGLEGAYSKELQGVNGKKLMQKTARGSWKPLNDESLVEPEHGKDIISTIDINIQDVAESALKRQLIRHGADHGCAILMEVQTGAIKAIANLKLDTSSGNYYETYNYAVGASSEPGSTFKLASLLVALEDGKFDLDDTVNTGDGTTMYYDRKMEDSHKGGYGKVNVQRAFEVSSNVGVSKLIYKAYSKNPQEFIDGLSRLGINKPLGIEIKGEGQPKIKSPKDKKEWSGVTLPWMSIGYELAITPLQTLALYNAVANDGKMIKPMFVTQIKQTGKTLKTFEPIVLNEAICSPATIKKAKIMLEGVVERGTATNLKNPIYKIAGKTGTAQIAAGSGGYNKTNYKASFVGYFPADKPKYSCIVVINNPTSGIYYGGSVAGPVFKEIADKVYATELEIQENHDTISNESSVPLVRTGYQDELLKIYSTIDFETSRSNPTANWVKTSNDHDLVKLQTKRIKYGFVPDVIGMSAKDAVFLLEDLGLNVKMIGKGKVKKQSIVPGTRIIAGTSIIIELKS